MSLGRFWGAAHHLYAMGASYFEVVWYFLLEARGALILSVTTGTIGLIGAAAMAAVSSEPVA